MGVFGSLFGGGGSGNREYGDAHGADGWVHRLLEVYENEVIDSGLLKNVSNAWKNPGSVSDGEVRNWINAYEVDVKDQANLEREGKGMYEQRMESDKVEDPSPLFKETVELLEEEIDEDEKEIRAVENKLDAGKKEEALKLFLDILHRDLRVMKKIARKWKIDFEA